MNPIEDDTNVILQLDVVGLSVECTLRWDYEWTIFTGGGTGMAQLDRTSAASISMGFTSVDYDTTPPRDATVSECEAVIQIADMSFDGDGLGFIGGVIDLFEGLLRGTVESKVRDAACAELRKLAGEGDETTTTTTVDGGGGALDYLIQDVGTKIRKHLEPMGLNRTSPLWVEKNTVIPTTTITTSTTNKDGQEVGQPAYMNFHDVLAQPFVNLALDELRSYLGRDSTSGDLGINAIIRDNILDKDGKYEVDPSTFFDLIVNDNTTTTSNNNNTGGVIFQGHDMLTETTLSISTITIEGLDTFRELNVLDDIGNYTLQNTFMLDQLSVVIEMVAEMKTSSKSDAIFVTNTLDNVAGGGGEPIVERFTINFNVSDIEVDLSMFLGIHKDRWGKLVLGQLLHMKNIFPCLVSIVDVAQVSGLTMTVGNITPPLLSGFLDNGIDRLVSNGAMALFDMYEGSMIRAMPNFFQSYVRDTVNEFLNEFLVKQLTSAECPEPAASTLDGIVDFRDLLLTEERAKELHARGNSPYGDLFRMFYSLIETMTSDTNKLNEFVASWTKRQSDVEGNLYYSGDLFKQEANIALNGLVAAIELGVSDLKVSNLDSIGSPIRVLQPIQGESSVLNNTASIGTGESLRVEARLLIKGKGNEVEINNDLVLGLNLKSVEMMLEILAQINESDMLVNFPLQDIMNLHCWLSTVVTPMLNKYGIRVGNPDAGIVLRQLAMAVSEASLDIKCIECSSPLIVEMESLLGTQAAVADTTEAFNAILDYISKLLGGDFIQYQLDKILSESALKCPHSPFYDPDFSGIIYEEMVASEDRGGIEGFLIAIICVVAITTIIAMVITVAARRVLKRRHDRWMTTLNIVQKLELEKMQSKEKEREKDLNSRMTSLFFCREVPWWIRVGIPIIIFGTIGLFLSGHLSLGGKVIIAGSFAGQEFYVDDFYEFSVVESVIEMWVAGARELAVLIAIFSGVWPYMKQLASLFIWFVPPKWMPVKRRGSILRWLDILGKWSIIDVFVLLMTLASFKLTVESPDNLSFLPSGLYSVTMLVDLQWGLYANALAQLVAQISSHVIIHYHRKCSTQATQAQEVEWNVSRSSIRDDPEYLKAHEFKQDYEASSKRLIVKKNVNWILLAAFISFAILVISGCVLPSFGIEVFGLVGLAVESGNQFEQAKEFYSVFGLANMIIEQARFLNTVSDFVGLGSLSALLVITVFLVPLLQAATLLAEWFCPMTKKQRLRNMVLNEILFAWQYMEVYVLSIIISAWQLGGVSEYMINVYCGSLKNAFNSLSFYGILSEDDAQCFKVEASVEKASWILVSACLILCMLNHFISGASMQKMKDDEVPSDRRLHSDRWLSSKVVVTSGDGVAPVHTATSLSEGSDEDEILDWIDYEKEPCVLPVKARFTDYYFFATARIDESDPVLATGVIPDSVINETGRSDSDSNGLSKLE